MEYTTFASSVQGNHPSSTSMLGSLYQAFQRVEDPRSRRGRHCVPLDTGDGRFGFANHLERRRGHGSAAVGSVAKNFELRKWSR